ncbi:M48 family metalloprotease [Sandaracinobacteroides hominis]|uniref:M48 family metalloprotease n=1 Tax=Sandaracinobacteroides hominis TaxID=2780086 RepID=UPI0018F3F6B0|nr:M48 family metalloprotease [Sandaracinobacteroides hominis]
MRRVLLAAGSLAAAATLLVGAPVSQPAVAQAKLTGLSPRDKQVGAEGYREIVQEFGGKVDGPLAAYVRQVGLKVAMASVPGSRPEDWTVTVLNSPVPNAMATPGGYLYITRGLLAMINNEAELASVLGHEAGHVAANHSGKRNSRAAIGGLASIAAAMLGGSQVAQMVNMGAGAWVSGFSRSQENEADTLGMRYSMIAGYDPHAAATMLSALDRVNAVEGKENLERGGTASIFSTHPVTAERVQRVSRAADATGRTGVVNRNAYLAALDGMHFGDAPEQGIISGPSFRHAALGFGFDAPPGFTLQNSPQAIAGRGRDGSNFIFTGVQARQGQSLQDITATVWQQVTNNRVPRVSYSERRINGLEAANSTAPVYGNQGQMEVGVHAFRWDANTVYVVRTIAPAGRGQQFDPFIASFRRLSPQEISHAQRGRRIDVVTVKPGDTVASLAARMAPPYNREQSFLALNGIQNRALQPGEQLKLIVVG